MTNCDSVALYSIFFFNDTATTEIYTLSLPTLFRSLPNAGKAPTPDDRLIRFRRLKKSARSWILTRSVIPMFLMKDRSTSPKDGAYHLFLETLPRGDPVQPGSPALGSQKAVGLIHSVPAPGTNLWSMVTPL